MIVPSSNVTMETEVPELLHRREANLPDDRFTLHSSRMPMKHVTPEALALMNAQMDRCAAELADARCDVVATACLVAIMAQGAGFHCEAEQTIRDVFESEAAGAEVISSAGALITALNTLGACRIGLITPYMRPLTALVVDYLESEGFDVQDSVSLEVADNLAVAELDPTYLEEYWKRLDLFGCDALVLSACVQMPSLPAIDPVERACGLPVVSAATATTFCLLRSLGLGTGIEGAGKLLSGAVDACFDPVVKVR
jgi:maleate isomerase